MIDLANLEGRDTLGDYRRINHELTAFDEDLSQKPQIVVGNKIDLIDQDAIREEIDRFASAGIHLIPISAATGFGLRELVNTTYDRLQVLRKEETKQSDGPRRRVYRFEDEQGFRVERDGDVFVVRGKSVEELVSKLVLDSKDAQVYLSNRLEKMGVMRELERMGFTPENSIKIGGIELELEP
jgi:GTP-binding protein